MQVVDANLLLYAVNEDAPLHPPAQSWLDEALAGTETIALPWIAILAFLRLSTHPRVFPRPLSLEQSLGVLEGWLTQPRTIVLEPGPRHFALLGGLLGEAGVAGNHVTDAHIAALSLEHNAVLVSFDRDFGRYSGLRHVVPG